MGIARWHELEPPPLAGARPPRHHDAAHHRWLHRALNPATSADAAAEAANRLGRPSRAAPWADLLAGAAQLAPVLVHGDIHEGQLLAEGDQLTGIMDWETARVDHPFWDFDLGEWGTRLWRRRRRDFSALWARAWAAYAEARGLDTGSRPVETAFRIRHALRLLADPGDPAVVGTLEEQLAHLLWSLALVEEGHQLHWRHHAVGVLAQLRDLRPVDIAVEAHADPAASANVGRPEKPVRRAGDKLGLRARRRGAPQVRKLIVMVP